MITVHPIADGQSASSVRENLNTDLASLAIKSNQIDSSLKLSALDTVDEIDVYATTGKYLCDVTLPIDGTDTVVASLVEIIEYTTSARVVQIATTDNTKEQYSRYTPDGLAVNYTAWVHMTVSPYVRHDGTVDITGQQKVNGLAVGENIQFLQATDPSFEGMTLRIGTNGMLELYRVPSNDHEQTDVTVTDFPVTVIPAPVGQIVADVDYLTTDSAYAFSGAMSNSSNVDVVVTFTGSSDSIGDIPVTRTVVVEANTTNQSFSLSGILEKDLLIGTTAYIDVQTTVDGAITLLGSTGQATIFTIRKYSTDTSDLLDRVTDLESINYYEFAKVGAIGTPAEDPVNWSTLIEANAWNDADLPAGTYEISMGCTFSMGTANKPLMMGFGQDVNGNGVIYEYVNVEVKDTTNKETYQFTYPHIHGGGSLALNVSVAAESGASGTLYFSNIVVDRKK